MTEKKALSALDIFKSGPVIPVIVISGLSGRHLAVPEPLAMPIPEGLDFGQAAGRIATPDQVTVQNDAATHFFRRQATQTSNILACGRAHRPLALRYRLVLHKNADLNQLFREYSTTKP